MISRNELQGNPYEKRREQSFLQFFELLGDLINILVT